MGIFIFHCSLPSRYYQNIHFETLKKYFWRFVITFKRSSCEVPPPLPYPYLPYVNWTIEKRLTVADKRTNAQTYHHTKTQNIYVEQL